jgi:anaerobic selenocysteine-containing dehydrogenase
MGAHLSAAAMRGENFSISRVQKEASLRTKNNELLAVPVTKLYDRGTTIEPAELLDQRVGELNILLNPGIAKDMGVESGQTVNISFNGVSGEASVKLDETVPEGVALIPRSMGLAIHEPTAVRVQSLVKGKVRA